APAAALCPTRRSSDLEAPFNYAEQARTILRACVHKGEEDEGHPMWDPATKLIKFVPEVDFSDPSYHLPHFYELFALWADERDRRSEEHTSELQSRENL